MKYQILFILFVVQLFIFATNCPAQNCGNGHFHAVSDSAVLAKAIARGLAPDEARRRMASQRMRRLNLLGNKEITVLVVTTKPSNLVHFDLQAAVKLLKSSTDDTSLCKIDFRQVNDTIIQNVWSTSRDIFDSWETLRVESLFYYDWSSRANIVIGVSDLEYSTYAGVANQTPNCNTLGKGHIVLTTFYKDYTTRLLAHELGHTIGLIHDDMPNSVMYSGSIRNMLTMSEKNKACYYTVAACTTTPTFDWEDKNIICSPNPVTNELTITARSVSEINKVSIYDILGKMIFEKNLNDINLLIDFSGFQSGLYYLKIKTPNKEFIKKIVKK